MQPRSLQQVLTELDSVYAPQIDIYRKKQSSIPGQVAAEEKGLEAKQETAFGDILNGARRRGTGVAFGGIPLGEQARYTADNFLPAVARLRQSGKEQAMSLEEAILGITERRMQQGQGIYQWEQQAAEQRRQFDEQQRLQREQMAQQAAAARAAASGGGFGPSYGGDMGGGGGAPAGKAGAMKKQNGGYAFTDNNGRPISAAAYAAATGTPFRTLLQMMANSGDGGAKQALGFVGNDFGYDPRKVNAGVYNALTWGVRPAASAPRQTGPTPNPYQQKKTAYNPPRPNNLRLF